ncbi:P1 family peptidase [Paenibacillus sp. D2_2]|uniref:P1 family peptidase n=1 Tax=Paenibacillus sp. D2_2 TaxID=3073092 RepID=UPI0028166511|nr:P1 family peptidase [Paenibacillus sp. D2_2]WMT41237.1 P1 family peptidase [Paenibacillus sp. D2_2]
MHHQGQQAIRQLNAAIHNLRSARYAVRHRKNSSVIRKIKRSQFYIDKSLSAINVNPHHRRKDCFRGDNSISNQPIGPSPESLIGHTDTCKGGITDIPGILVGHAEDESGRSGCTVVLYPKGAVPGVDVRGGFPGTEQTDALHPGTATETVQAVLLTGGSNFGLATAAGVMNWLAERGFGAPTAGGVLPTVPAAVIFDLIYAKGARRPDAAMGYAASQTANAGPVAQGSVGAGAGATVGKIYGTPMKGGVGTASWQIPGGPMVAAIVVVNALGDIWNHDRIIAGALQPNGTFVNQTRAILEGVPPTAGQSRNTTIAVVATTAKLTKAEASRIATLAHDGMARAISPVHTQGDGDTIFCLATGTDTSGLVGNEAVTAVGTAAAIVLEQAIIRGVQAAQ